MKLRTSGRLDAQKRSYDVGYAPQRSLRPRVLKLFDRMVLYGVAKGSGMDLYDPDNQWSTAWQCQDGILALTVRHASAAEPSKRPL